MARVCVTYGVDHDAGTKFSGQPVSPPAAVTFWSVCGSKPELPYAPYAQLMLRSARLIASSSVEMNEVPIAALNRCHLHFSSDPSTWVDADGQSEYKQRGQPDAHSVCRQTTSTCFLKSPSFPSAYFVGKSSPWAIMLVTVPLALQFRVGVGVRIKP